MKKALLVGSVGVRLAAALACACGGGAAGPSPSPSPSPCPTSGRGAIVSAAAVCLAVPPAATGAAPGGEGAEVASYALAPVGAPSGFLVLFLNGSGGTPAGAIADPADNVYTALVADGHHVVALSYRSSQALAGLCAGRDDCFLPTRMTIVTGVDQPGSAAHLQPSEGIEPRLVALLGYLAAAGATGGWDAFLDHGEVRWSSVIATGHSQGGGHAALLARLHPVARFVALAAPCDQVGGVAASWLHPDAAWLTPATRGWGFSAPTVFDAGGAPVGGDLNCPAHAAAWTALGLDAAQRFDDAAVCGGSPHLAPIVCPENLARLRTLFRL